MPKVLIIDDEPFTVEMLQTFLQINGYEAVGALTGQDGIVLTQVESPDVVILDLMLPDIDGFDVCRRLRSLALTARLPVLILSARTSRADRDKGIAAGANGYLTKPVQFPELLIELKRLLTVIPGFDMAPMPDTLSSSTSSVPSQTLPAKNVPVSGLTNMGSAGSARSPEASDKNVHEAGLSNPSALKAT